MQASQSELPALSELKAKLAKYRNPDWKRSVWQIATTLIPFIGLIVAMYMLLDVSVWLTLALSIPAALFMVRLFILHHDCGHGSFFKSNVANDIVGFILGAMSMTPYHAWRWSHAMHHGSTGDLDHRGHGDIPTLTVAEYYAMHPVKRFFYRVYRHPIVLFGIIPVFLFTVLQRIPSFSVPKTNRKARLSAHLTNLVLLGYAALMIWLFGFWPFVLVHLTTGAIAASSGMWLFYVQHQFEDTYWQRNDRWDYVRAAIAGSSHYDLPVVLQWFTANIGLHHIHHLDSRIPNYYLQRCYRENPVFHQVTRLTLWESLKCVYMNLWDEESQKMVSFRQAKQKLHQQQAKKAEAPAMTKAAETWITTVLAATESTKSVE